MSWRRWCDYKKQKKGKLIKETSTKDGATTGYEIQLDKFDLYLNGKKRKVDALTESKKDEALNDCISGKNGSQLKEILKTLKAEFKQLHSGNLYAGISRYNAIEKKNLFEHDYML